MTTVNTMLERWKNLDIEKLINESFDETADEYAKANAEQMFSGQLNTGKKIKPKYKPSTIIRKKRKGQPTDRVTLRDTQDFQDNIEAERSGSKVKLSSEVEYAQYLEKKYSKDIWALNPEFREKYIPVFYSVLQDRVSKLTGLKFSK